MPTQTLPPTIVYITCSLPPGQLVLHLLICQAARHIIICMRPPHMEQPAWRFAPPSYAPSSDREYNVPQSVGTAAQLLPMCHSSVVPSEAYDPLPQSTQMVPSHQVPSTKVHQPSNTYQTPSSFTNQEGPAPAPRVASKRHETMHAPTPAASNRAHDPVQQSKQTVLSRVPSTIMHVISRHKHI